MTQAGRFDIIFSGTSAPDFVAWLRSAPKERWPHLLLLDLMVERAPSVDVELVKAFLKGGLLIVVISAFASPPLTRSIIRAGVTGVVGKRDAEEDILAAIYTVLRGEEWMTAEVASLIAGDPDRPALSIQEERALVLYASGLTLEEVATAMNIGRETAKQYLDRVKKKYGAAGITVRSKLDFGRIAWSGGYVDLHPPQKFVSPDA